LQIIRKNLATLQILRKVFIDTVLDVRNFILTRASPSVTYAVLVGSSFSLSRSGVRIGAAHRTVFCHARLERSLPTPA
jgi:hypothetical protein